jgi:hypothetical protein
MHSDLPAETTVKGGSQVGSENPDIYQTATEKEVTTAINNEIGAGNSLDNNEWSDPSEREEQR